MLFINEGLPCFGIIYLRLKRLNTNHVIAALETLLRLEMEIDVGTILVVHDTKIRIRHNLGVNGDATK